MPILAWSDLHDLALVYHALLCSMPAEQGASGRVEPSHNESARRRLAQLYPEVSDARLHRVFREALLTYVGVAGAPMLDVAVVSLRRALPRSRRLAVLDDLAALASAGEDAPRPSGASFLQHLAARWDLDPAPPGRSE